MQSECSTEPQKRVRFSVDIDLSEGQFEAYQEVMRAEETDRSGLANELVTSSLRGMVELLFVGQPEKMHRLVKLLKEEEQQDA